MPFQTVYKPFSTCLIIINYHPLYLLERLVPFITSIRWI
nr:MAG TPA: hypothetical protein [Caudoviricetes sp.]